MPSLKPPSAKHPSPEYIQEAHRILEKALKEFKDTAKPEGERYHNVIRLLTSENTQTIAQALGYSMQDGLSLFLRAEQLVGERMEKVYKEIIDTYASFANIDFGRRTLNIPAIAILTDKGDFVPPYTLLPADVLRECALVAMEEWLHLLQNYQPGGLFYPADTQDSEIDVALYFLRHSISLRDTFFIKRRHRKRDPVIQRELK